MKTAQDQQNRTEMSESFKLVQLEDYEQFVGAETVERLLKKGKSLQDLHVVHVNSTYYGGGVAELLSSLTLLMHSAGVKTGWRVIQGSPDFFTITKKMHNALQGGSINLTDLKKQIYERVIYENSVRNHLDHDVVVIHDPQPLPMIMHYRKRAPWIWRCHIDLSHPNTELWNYLTRFINKYDAAIFTLPEYKQTMETPVRFFAPAIDPFSIKNRELSEKQINGRLEYYHIPTDLPIVAQISRFDRWKDPEGVIEAFKIARKEADCTLVLLGNVATDDPEGEEVYNKLLDYREERIIIMSRQDSALVNALQRRAAVILQLSKREGFGLTVTEAMWKGTPVIGRKVGGIRHQITDGENGMLVTTVDEAAKGIVQLLREKNLRKRLGENAREAVRKNFLMTSDLERYLDLFRSLETVHHLRD
jgi:trehalose synthase